MADEQVAADVNVAAHSNPQSQQARFRGGSGVDTYCLKRFGNSDEHKFQQHIKPSYKPARPRPARQQGKVVTGGPGMQAVFLDSATNKKSCGTGVFLPQIRPDIQPHPVKKPACSPILLPSHVVQALTSRKEINDLNVKKKVLDQKREDTIRGPPRVFSDKEYSSPEIFLPKEWTY